ncbi:hypothetical protein L6R52_09565 [Myxococcota bacterium]|nr:hypothetical protein [Myxococcota bacterium]
MKKIWTLALLTALPLVAAGTVEANTRVPGHQGPRVDADGNGHPDAGVIVNGHYESLYAYDAYGKWYWDLGDGRIRGNVGSVDQLDQATLTECDYVVNYRGTFENTAFQDTGWISNHVRCHGYAGQTVYRYLVVHQTDPRYTGNPDWAIWGDWEYHVLTESGTGNWVTRPETHVGD